MADRLEVLSQRGPQLLIAMAIVTAAWPAAAGMIMKQTSTTTGGDENLRMVMEIAMDGDNVRMTFLESDNPMMTSGSYLLKTKKATFLVYPDRKSYMRMDQAELDAMGAQAGQAMNQATQKRNEEAERRGFGKDTSTLKGFIFKPLVDESGPTLLGYPTHHYKYELKYKVSQTYAGTGAAMERSVDRTEEFWATTAIDMSGANAARDAMRGMSAGQTGDEGFPEVAQAEQTLNEKGFRLKSVSEIKESNGIGGLMGTMMKIQTLGMAGAGKSDTKRTNEVVELRPADVPASTFALPKGYSETSMIGPSNMPNLNQPGTGGMPDLNQMPQDGASSGGMPDLDHLPPN